MADEKLDLILKELQGMKQEQQEFKQDLQGMKQEQQEFKQELQGMKQDQQEFKQELQGIKQEQQDMKSQMNNRFDMLETTLGFVKEKVNGMDQKLDGIHEQVADNAENIETMKVDIKQIKDVQVRQEKTVDLLARRSIDQEAELRKIKQDVG